MTILLGIDLETTGLNPEEHHITEIGAVLWDTETKGPIACYSVLIKDCPDPEITPEIEKLTGITKAIVMKYGQDLDAAMRQILVLADQADYIVAHNHEFERNWLDLIGYYFTLPWIDTLTDLPDRTGSGKLTYLAADHGFTNPFPHRALPDVLTMFKILSMYDFTEVERLARAEKKTLVVKFAYDAAMVDKIKALGFRWEAETKQWRKVVRDFEQQEVSEALWAEGFTVHVLEKEEVGRPHPVLAQA